VVEPQPVGSVPARAVDPALLAAHQALGAEATAALEGCDREVVSRLSPREAGAPPSLTEAEVQAGCAEIGRVWGRHKEQLLGTSREAARCLGGLARVAEDVRMLTLALRREHTGALMDGAVKHLVDSVPDVLPVARGLQAGTEVHDERVVSTQVVPPDVLRERVGRMISNDRHDVQGLLGAFRNFGYEQAGDPELVRGPILEHHGALAELRLAQKRAAMRALRCTEPAAIEEVVAPALAYLDLADAVVASYRRAERAMISGSWGGQEGADALLAELVAALDAWRPAWEGELRRVGIEPDLP
jgi:hypothetical protein